MFVKRLTYGAQIAGPPAWFTGIALSNFSTCVNTIGAEYSDAVGNVFLERSYAVSGIKTFTLKYTGLFKAVFWSTKPFELTWFTGNKDVGFTQDYFPTSFYPPLEENQSVKMVSLSDTYYMSIAGKLKYITERAGTALKWICREYYSLTTVPVKILDLNGLNNDNQELHPLGTHIFEDGDFEYNEDLSLSWLLMKNLIDPFPNSFIQTHKTLIWPKLLKYITPEELDKYKPHILLDINPDWHHDKHFHWHKGSSA